MWNQDQNILLAFEWVSKQPLMYQEIPFWVLSKPSCNQMTSFVCSFLFPGRFRRQLLLCRHSFMLNWTLRNDNHQYWTHAEVLTRLPPYLLDFWPLATSAEAPSSKRVRLNGKERNQYYTIYFICSDRWNSVLLLIKYTGSSAILFIAPHGGALMPRLGHWNGVISQWLRDHFTINHGCCSV